MTSWSRLKVKRPWRVSTAERLQLSGPMILLVVGLAYLGASQALIWANSPGGGSMLWPGAGISLAALLILPERRWGWVIAAVVVTEFTGNLARGYPVVPSLWWTAGNGIEPLIGATLLRRFGNSRGDLVPLRNLWRFLLLGVIVAPMFGAAIGTLGTLSARSMSSEMFWQVWLRNVKGDALGVLVMAPLILTWRVRRQRRHVVEYVAISVAAASIALLALQPSNNDLTTSLLPYLIIPILAWSALRFGLRGAAVAVFAMAQVATWAAVQGSFGEGGTAGIVLPIFFIVSGCSVFVVAVVVEDLVERTEVERQLREQAYLDDLTGLPNRRFLTEHFRHQRGSDRTTRNIGVLALGVDGLQSVNDGFGHRAGDEVLIEIARRVRNRIGSRDLVSRLSGDEFIVITDVTDGPLDALARELIAAISEPLTMSTGTKMSPSVSIGITHGTLTDPDALLRDADAALQHAKQGNGGDRRHFDEPLRQLVHDRTMIYNQIRGALANGEITAHYQPEIDISTGEIFCFEALARWHHPTEGLISPGRFVPIIEDMGTAGDLFTRILGDALEAQAHWSTELGCGPAVAVNLSVSQLADPGLLDTITDALQRTQTPPGALCLEVTETALAREPFTDLLMELNHLGIRLALDDFGTGWSSVSRLASVPWHVLKIDMSFIAALDEDDPHAELVVASMITMGHSLGVLVTAEGIETAYQLERLTQLGCDIAQGFIFSSAVPVRDATAYVSDRNPWTGPPRSHRHQRLASLTT